MGDLMYFDNGKGIIIHATIISKVKKNLLCSPY